MYEQYDLLWTNSRKNATNIDTLQIFEVNIFYSGLMDTKLRKWASGFE